MRIVHYSFICFVLFVWKMNGELNLNEMFDLFSLECNDPLVNTLCFFHLQQIQLGELIEQI